MGNVNGSGDLPDRYPGRRTPPTPLPLPDRPDPEATVVDAMLDSVSDEVDQLTEEGVRRLVETLLGNGGARLILAALATFRGFPELWRHPAPRQSPENDGT